MVGVLGGRSRNTERGGRRGRGGGGGGECELVPLGWGLSGLLVCVDYGLYSQSGGCGVHSVGVGAWNGICGAWVLVWEA